MAQRRVNKGLVAALTIVGMVLSVGIFAMAAYRQANRDPEVFAKAGRELEAAGDKERAIDRYRKAYEVRKEVKYLVDAARCSYEIGEIVDAVRFLIAANSQTPNDDDVLAKLLGYLWELRNRQPVWADLRKYSDEMLALKPNDVFALVCNSQALDALVSQDASFAEKSRQQLDRAVQLEPDNPEVALLRSERELRAAAEADSEAKAAQHRAAALQYLQSSLAKQPGHPGVTIRTSALLSFAGKNDEARSVIQKSIDAKPDDPELHLAMGNFLGRLFRETADKLPAEERTRLFDDAKHALMKSLEDAGMYQSYSELAALYWANVDKSADPAADLTRRGKSALSVFDDGLERTIALKSVRARLNFEGRALLHFEAFQSGLRYFGETRNADERKDVLARIRGYYDKAAAAFPTWHVTPYMQGSLAVIDGNYRAAIQCFEKSNEAFARGNWTPAIERLARLYEQEREYGRALTMCDSVIDNYRRSSQEPPREILVCKLRVLNSLKRAQEALNLSDDMLRRNPKDEELLAAKAEALRQLGRVEEAKAAIAAAPEQSGRLALGTAILDAQLENYGSAIQKLRELLEREPKNVAAISTLLRVATTGKRQEDARAIIASLAAKAGSDEAYARYLKSVDVILSTADEKQRDAKLLELIQGNPDAVAREADLFNYYVERSNRDEATKHLAELVRLRPDDPNVLEKDFAMALTRRDWTAAEKTALRLAEMNADNAHGAVFRGRLEGARGNFAAAVTEFRAAEQALPGDSSLKTFLADALMRTSRPNLDEVAAKLEESLQINPQNFGAHKLLYSVYGALDRREDSIKHLAEAAKIEPRDVWVQERKQIVEEEQNPKVGITRREAERQKNPSDLENLTRLIELYTKADDMTKAEETIKAAQTLAPTSIEVLRLASRHYGKTGRFEEGEQAISAFQNAAQGVDKVQAEFLRAKLCERRGDEAAAVESYAQADRLAESQIADPEQRRIAQADARFQLARFYLVTGQPLKMVDAQRRVLEKLKPEETQHIQRARLAIIEGLLNARRFGDTEKEVEAYVKDFPTETRGLLLQGKFFATTRQFDKAREVYSRVLRSEPNNALAYYLRGLTNLDTRDFSTARTDLAEAKRLAPKDFALEHLFALATAYEADGQVAAAEAELRGLLEANPGDSRAAERLVQLYARHDKADRAEGLAREFMAKQPDNAYWPYLLGRQLMFRQDFSSAVDPLQNAIRLGRQREMRPEALAAIHADLLIALTRANRAAEGVKIYESLEEAIKLPGLCARGGEAYLRVNRRPEGIAAIEQAIRSGALAGWPVLISVVSISRELLQPDEQLAVMQKVASAESIETPHGVRLKSVLAQELVRAGRRDEGLKVIEPIIQNAQLDKALRVAALEIKSEALVDAAERVRVYEQILMEDENNPAVLNNIAYTLADELNRAAEGVRYATRAAELKPEDANVLDTLGWVQFQAGDSAAAEKTLADAVRIDPENVPARYHQGRVFAKLGRPPQARDAYEKALRTARRRADYAPYVEKIEAAIRELK